jgi:putative peptide zinc metalloprotease protein
VPVAESLYPALARDVCIQRLDLEGSEPSYLVEVPGRLPFKAGRALQQLLALMDGQHALEAIAATWSSDETAALSPAELQRYLERELVPAGVVTLGETRGGAASPVSAPKTAQQWLGPATAVLQHLFSVPSFLLMTPAIIGAHVWLYHQLFTGPPHLSLSRITTTDWILFVLLTAAAVFIHELGHLAACRRFCRNHSPLTVRLGGSVLNPLAEVTYAWRLPRRQRLVVDLGGAWLQLSFATGLTVLYVVVHSPGIPLAIYLSEFGLLLALLPLPGRDGVWIFRDLAGFQGTVGPGSRFEHGLRVARGYQFIATGFFAISQAMAIVLGIALLRAIGQSGLRPSSVPLAALLIALGWLQLRLISLVVSLLAALWVKRRGDVVTQASQP